MFFFIWGSNRIVCIKSVYVVLTLSHAVGSILSTKFITFIIYNTNTDFNLAASNGNNFLLEAENLSQRIVMIYLTLSHLGQKAK